MEAGTDHLLIQVICNLDVRKQSGQLYNFFTRMIEFIF